MPAEPLNARPFSSRHPRLNRADRDPTDRATDQPRSERDGDELDVHSGSLRVYVERKVRT